MNICGPTSHYSDFAVDNNCLASIVRNSSNIFKQCNLKNVENSDIFIKHIDKYFYSVINTRNLEIFCPQWDNTNITLKKLGKIKLKNTCHGKSYNIYIEGSSKFTLNKTINMEYPINNEMSMMLNINVEKILKYGKN